MYIAELPSTIGSLTNLEVLVACGNALQGMPAMSGCAALTLVNLGSKVNPVGNKLTAAGLEPFCSNPPPNLTKLQMVSCGLQELPQSFGDLSSLEYLELDRNDELKELPSTIGSLSKLKMLEACSCALIAVPASLKALTNLTDLKLQGNEELQLPAGALNEDGDAMTVGNDPWFANEPDAVLGFLACL